MKLWKGRFSKQATSSANRFNASIEVDQRMYRQDILGSIAHGTMLAHQGIISDAERDAIIRGLNEILQEYEAGSIQFTVENEDIHMGIESLLTEKIGDAGKKLHTARSRNDQVATDLRLYLKEEIDETVKLIDGLIQLIDKLMIEHENTILPGYTHMQRAQPVTLAWHLSAYREMFLRDKERFLDGYKRTDSMPLGACALAGTSYNIDREFVKAELGFSSFVASGAISCLTS